MKVKNILFIMADQLVGLPFMLWPSTFKNSSLR